MTLRVNGEDVGGALSDATPAALGTAAAGVSTSASRSDHVHEAPAAGGTYGTGTLAARPASPAAGDTYAVTSGAQTGARYTCFVTGSWEGTALPTASAAGQLPVSAGAGTTYAATTAGDVVDAAIASVVGAVAGQAIVGDGLGGVTETSADVSAVLAAASAAAALTALGGAGVTRFAPPLATGQGWTLDGTIAGMTWSYEAGDVARLTYAAGPFTHDLAGPQIERALTFDPGARYRVRVTPRAQTSSAGVRTMAGLYIRNAAATKARVLWWSGIERRLYTGPWTLNDGEGDGILNRGADGFTLDGTDSMEIRWDEQGALSYVAIGTTGLVRVLHTGVLGFVPAAFGLVGATDDAVTAGTQDFSGLSCEAFG